MILSKFLGQNFPLKDKRSLLAFFHTSFHATACPFCFWETGRFQNLETPNFPSEPTHRYWPEVFLWSHECQHCPRRELAVPLSQMQLIGAAFVFGMEERPWGRVPACAPRLSAQPRPLPGWIPEPGRVPEPGPAASAASPSVSPARTAAGWAAGRRTRCSTSCSCECPALGAVLALQGGLGVRPSPALCPLMRSLRSPCGVLSTAASWK